VFAHPACTIEEARAWLATLGDTGEAWIVKSTTEGQAADRKLAAAGWSLTELARRYRKFCDTFAPVRAAIGQRQIAAQPAFVVRTLLIHEYRKVHLQDPLLPSSLLPPDWIGAEAYELCRTLYAAVFAAADDFLSDTARRIREPLPPPEPAAYRRFGGIAENATP
jgi:phenylacetic acid degradation operon negative regulatory protein